MLDYGGTYLHQEYECRMFYTDINFRSKTILLIVCLVVGCSDISDPELAFKEGNYKKAFTLWKKRADKGDLEAQYQTGMMYYLGLGVGRDLNKAIKWYELAATSGHPSAQRDLGMMYESGRAGVKDFELAYLWLFAAYQQGNPNAAAGLEMLAGHLSPNRTRLLKLQAKKYIKNDVIDPEDDDY